MADIPRVPQVTPPALVNPQVHKVDHSGDRRPRKEHKSPKEDTLELHDSENLENEEEANPLPESTPDSDSDGWLDIAV